MGALSGLPCGLLSVSGGCCDLVAGNVVGVGPWPVMGWGHVLEGTLMGWFILGLWIGSFAGFFLCALIVANGRDDRP